MNEEPQASERPPAALPAKSDSEGEGLWLQSVRLIWNNRAATLLPLTVTQLPFALLTGAVFFYLFRWAYPDATFDSFNWLAEAPGGARLTLVLVGAAQTLFSMVGAAGTMVSVAGLAAGKPTRLAEALDPAFTRMGGLLLFGVVFNLMVVATAFGIIVLLYFFVRLGLTVQAYILEGASPLSAFGRSWGLLRGRMWRFFALLLTSIPVALVFLLGSSFVVAIAAAPFGAEPSRTTELVFQSIAICIVGITLVPLGAYLATSTTLFYLSAKEQVRA